MHRHAGGEPGPVAGQELDRLIEAEARWAARLDAARADARALTARAQDQARDRRADVARTAAARRREAEEAIARTRARRLRETADDWRRRSERLEHISDDRLEALAGRLLDLLLAAPESEGG